GTTFWKSSASPIRRWCCPGATRPAPPACLSPVWRRNAGTWMNWPASTATSRSNSGLWKRYWKARWSLPTPLPPACCCCTRGAASCCTIRSCRFPCCRSNGPGTPPGSCAGGCIGNCSTRPSVIWTPWRGTTMNATRRWRPAYTAASAAGRMQAPSGAARPLHLEKVLAVVLHFFNGFVDVGQRFVAALFLEPLVYRGRPAARQFLQRADIQVAVMEEAFQVGHVGVHETPVLADGVAAQRRLARRHVLRQKIEQYLLGLRLGQRGSAHLVDKAALAVGGLVPVVHRLEQDFGLMHHQHGAFGHHAEIGLGDHYRNLDDALFGGIEPGHLHIEPDQAVFVRSHIICL